MGLSILGVAEAKVRHGDAIRHVFRARDGLVDTDGRMVDRCNFDEDHRSVCPALAVADLVGDGRVTTEVCIGRVLERAIGIDEHRAIGAGRLHDTQHIVVRIRVVAQNHYLVC